MTRYYFEKTSFALLLTVAFVLLGCSTTQTTTVKNKADIEPIERSKNLSQRSKQPSYPRNPKPTDTSAAPTTQKQMQFDTLFEEWRGTPYRLGGSSKSGIDCSAWTQLVYRQIFDKRLPRETHRQADFGNAVLRQELRFGDLVFFITARNIQHVGVYLYDGYFVHASTKAGVTASSIKNPYWSQRFWQARRLD